MISHTFRRLRFPVRLVGQIRRVETANFLIAIACMLLLVEACVGASDPARASEVVVRTESLSVVVRPSDGTYEIQTGVGGRSTIHARVAAEIDHKWVKSTFYPKHEISQSNFEDALAGCDKMDECGLDPLLVPRLCDSERVLSASASSPQIVFRAREPTAMSAYAV